MSYFDDYLEKINRNGTDIKERIVTQREKKFDAFLKKSVYSSDTITDEAGKQYSGVIHPTKDSEKTCIYTFMSYKKDIFTPGTLLKDKDKTWLITHKILDDTKGYNCYTLMYLPIVLTIIDGENKFSFPARLTNDSSAAIEDFLSILSTTNREYRGPDRNIKVICKKYNFFKKDQKLVVEDDTYKIEGINKTAVPGCIYLTLGQCLADAAKYDGDADETNNSFWGDK